MDSDHQISERTRVGRLPSSDLLDRLARSTGPLATGTSPPTERLSASRLPSTDYEQVFDRALSRAEAHRRLLDRERTEAAQLHSLLVHRSPGQRRLLLWNLPVRRAYSLVALLVEESHRRVFDDPEVALDRAELATRIAGELDAGHYGPCLVAEISARAWACLGHAARIAGHAGRSAEAFAQAHGHLADSPGEPLEEGCLLDLQSSLLASRGELLEAGFLLARAAERFRVVGDGHRLGRVEIKRGVVELRRGLPKPALEWLRRGLTRAEGARDPYAVAVGYALQAALAASPRPAAVEVLSWEALRNARRWTEPATGRPVVPLIRKVEGYLTRQQPDLEELLPVWPRRL